MKTGYEDFFRKARVQAGVSEEKPTARFALRSDSDSKRRDSGPSQKKSGSVELDKARIHALREKVKATRKKNKRNFPVRFVLLSFMGLAVAAFGLEYHEEVERLLSRIEVSATKASASEEHAEAETKPDAKADGKAEDKAATDAKQADGKARAPAAIDTKQTPDWSDAEINHLQKLVQRKEQLDAREAELGRLETELAAQKEELEKKLKSMDETRSGISTMLQERTTQDAAKVDTLVQMYSNMKASQAAKVLESLDEDLAVEIIGRMKKKNAAEVLNLMKPEKAQVFSEKFAGYRKK